jgi:hypothetical protein
VKPDEEKEDSEDDPEDPFPPLVKVLCDIRIDWERKRKIVVAIGQLVGAAPDGELPEKVAGCISDPVETRKQEAEIRRLQEEVDRMKAEILVHKENFAATKAIAEDARKVMEQVKATFGETGTAVTRAKLFDERVHEEKKLSGTRIVRILGDFADQVETTMKEARKAADRMEESTRMLSGATCSRGTRLSEISLPDSFPDVVLGEGKDVTPKSKRSQATVTTGVAIDLDSPARSPEGNPVPRPVEVERSRNLNDVFDQMDPEADSATIGSRIVT